MAQTLTLSNFVINETDPINPTKLNEIIKNFIGNDMEVYSRFDKIPKVWKCNWYNDNSIPGYSRGEFFWLNTEEIEKFMMDNAKEMQELTNANPLVTQKLPNWKSNNADIYNQYYNVLTGYHNDTQSGKLSALYAIGELSAPAQLIVSLKDNNKAPVDDETSWKRFLITNDDYDKIVNMIYVGLDSAISTHEQLYHFGNENLTPAISASLSRYADADLGNVSAMYPGNYLLDGGHAEGFDTVQVYVKRPYPDRSLSGYTIENQWFRKWRSGYLEHGGLIVPTEFLDSYRDSVSVDFRWSLLGDGSNAYAMKYLGWEGAALSVDESRDSPPGDNLISVLIELDKEDFQPLSSTSAPAYSNSNYSVTVTPCYPNEGIVSAMLPEASYSGLGNNSIVHNMVENEIELENVLSGSFSFKYNRENTPGYYYYYAAGFCTL